jgi:hypothetical protein
MSESDHLPEHLAMIQAVVSRMAANSFLIKGWTVTLVAGLSAVASARSDRGFAWIAVGVVVVFATLDAYYLALERVYRDLYDRVVAGTESRWTLAADKVGPAKVANALHAFAVWPIHGGALVGAVIVATSA